MKSWLHWRKRDFCHQFSEAKFSFQVIWIMSHSWLLRSRSTAEQFLAVRCHENTQCLPATLARELHQAKAGIMQNQAAVCQGRGIPHSGEVSGLYVLPVVAVSGVPTQWQLVLLMNTASVWCTASLRSHQFPLVKYSKVDSSADYFLTVAIRESMFSVNVVGEYSRLYVEYFHNQ